MTKEEIERVKSEYKYIHTGSNTNINRIRLSWHLTDWCNYNCPYCIQTCEHHYASKPKETQESREELAKTLRPKFTNQYVTLTLYGGEITFHYDLVKLCEILFKDNNCKGVVTLLTNFSAPIETYQKFMGMNIPGITPIIIPSYQWSNRKSFLPKAQWLKGILREKFQCTCVVYDKTSLKDLNDVTEDFTEAGVPIRFTFGRIPGSGNKFFDFQEGVSEFIKSWNKENFEKFSCKIVYVDERGEQLKKARGDILKEVSEFEGRDKACFNGMHCTTGLALMPSGDLRAGSCPDRCTVVVGNLFTEPETSVKPYKAICGTDEGCNLCNSILIWNGRF